VVRASLVIVADHQHFANIVIEQPWNRWIFALFAAYSARHSAQSLEAHGGPTES